MAKYSGWGIVSGDGQLEEHQISHRPEWIDGFVESYNRHKYKGRSDYRRVRVNYEVVEHEKPDINHGRITE